MYEICYAHINCVRNSIFNYKIFVRNVYFRLHMTNQLNIINADLERISSATNIKTDLNNSNNTMQYVPNFDQLLKV